MRLIDLLYSKRTIINIDETWINETNFTRMMWCTSKGSATYTSKGVNPRLAVLAALTTDGDVYFALTQTNTDSDVLMLFMKHLIRHLDVGRADWRNNTSFLLDNARYHASDAMKEYFRKMEVDVIYTGPYSFTSAPIEMLFSALKRGEINPEQDQTGKR